jgi:sRNA-binding protein
MKLSTPLAVGFQKQVMSARPEHITRAQLREYLKVYTSRNTYYRALQQVGAVRFNFDGSIQAEVSTKHARRAGRRGGQG